MSVAPSSRSQFLVVLLLLAMVPIGPASAQDSLIALCRAAIRAAEGPAGIPAGLLHAIGRVESGRRDPATGTFGPWPWTINAEGRGRFFQTREEAIAEVRQLQARGVRIIDVGCMQINLHHHPNAFSSLEEAFDPAANARYAARFLTELQASRNDWGRAAANYHSNTPERAESYRALVMAAWPEEQRRIADPAATAAEALPSARLRGAVAGLGPSLSNGAARAQVLPPASAGAGTRAPTGRGLDAYRAAPITPSSRPTVMAFYSGIRRR